MVSLSNPTVFDAFAADYDVEFTQSPLGRLLRSRVWAKLVRTFYPNQHILELACGTGEDAVWLARWGVHVTATDGSAEMVARTEAKVEAAGMAHSVTAVQASLQEISSGIWTLERRGAATHYPQFDGVFSNFGGLNTISDWRPLAERLSGLLKPGGLAVLVPMGPWCPWEILWYAAHGRLKTALRRSGPAQATIGPVTIPIWYPSAGRLKADFAPWFSHHTTESLGLWLPPSYLDHFVDRWPGLFDHLNRLEQATARLTQSWGDHYIIVFERLAAP